MSDDEVSDTEEEVKGGAGAAEEDKNDLRDSNIVTKYKAAADIANAALNAVIALAVPGANVVALCDAGDLAIITAAAKVYNKKGSAKVEKGIAFPTCVSPNNIVGHFSPLTTESKVLAAGDVVKIDLGVHVDGFAAVVAHTIVLPGGEAKTAAAAAGAGAGAGAAPVAAAGAGAGAGAGAEGKADAKTEAKADGKISGRAADALAAAYTAADCVLRLLKPGGTNTAVTTMLQQVAADYKVSPLAGVLSHQMTKFVIDGKKVIINKPDVDQKVDEVTFAANEVWAIDIVMSTGDGKPKEGEQRTTVYKRAQETTYALKMKASRAAFSEINKNAPTYPFTIRSLGDEENKSAVKLGITECFKHGLVSAYPVLQEKEGEVVVHLKFTALLLPSGTVPITGLLQSPDRARLATEHKVSAAVETILKSASSSSSATKNKNKKKKKAGAKKEGGAAATGAGAAAPEEESKAKKAAVAEPKAEAKAAEPKAEAKAATSTPTPAAATATATATATPVVEAAAPGGPKVETAAAAAGAGAAPKAETVTSPKAKKAGSAKK